MTAPTDAGFLVDVDKIMSAVPHVRALGIKVVSFERGRVTMALPFREDLVAYADTGVLAGGVVFTLMDTASGAAVFAARDVLGPVATLDLRIDYLKRSTAGQTLYADTHCYKLTHNIGFVRGVAYHDSPDDPIAHTSAAFMISHAGRSADKGAKDA